MAKVKPKPRRDYRLTDGTKVPGVTTVLNEIGWKTPGLVWWAFRMGQANPDARTPYEETDRAADIGTVVHRAVELIMHGEPEVEAEGHIRSNLPREDHDAAENALLAFYRWRDSVKLDVTDTEVALVSEHLRCGGTIDYVAKVAGARSMVDLKTSGGIYPDMWAQVGTYGAMWDEAHPEDPIVGGFYLLRIDKESGGFDFAYRPDLSLGVEAFKAARVLYDIRKQLK